MDTQNQGLKMLPDTTTAAKGPSTTLLSLEEFEYFRNPPKFDCKVPIEANLEVGKKWPEIGTDVLIDSEASIDKQYFMGMDIGFEKDTTVMAEGHIDTDGSMVIDRIIQPKPPLGEANQGL